MTERGPGVDEEPGVFDVADAAADEAATLRGLADVEAGKVVSHAAMKRWLSSWGTDDPVPPPACGE
jgi:predicted transcriptional regulator